MYYVRYVNHDTQEVINATVNEQELNDILKQEVYTVLHYYLAEEQTV